jgi:hypothetical protein
MMQDQFEMGDDELNTLLSVATRPAAPQGFEQRLLARTTAPAANNVIAFPHRKKTNSWIVGLPLAASLALGIWLGAAGLSSNLTLIPASTLVSDNSDDGTSTGFDDITQFIEDSLT